MTPSPTSFLLHCRMAPCYSAHFSSLYPRSVPSFPGNRLRHTGRRRPFLSERVRLIGAYGTPGAKISASPRQKVVGVAAGVAPVVKELPKSFDFASQEPPYSWWKSEGYFKPNLEKDAKPFVFAMPPPNVTGALHMGHAMFVTLEDIMTRHWRMRGHPSLWVPGIDHAGIATQLVVEKLLVSQGVKRADIGREFTKRVWDWKYKYGDTITNQMRRLGASCDWEKEHFTLAAELSKAVVDALVRLHERGLIYQGSYMVNWSPKLQTAVSDLANSSFVPEATEECLQYDTPEIDGNDDEFQRSNVVDGVENVDDKMEEVLAAMTSSISLASKLPVVQNLVCVGIDPDLSGAIAVLKSQDNCTIAEVIDVPCITVAVNKRMRRRHDYQSIAAIVKQLEAPQGSIAYVEQAMPFPKDGKQGWYISGYGYGVWLGILAAAGFTVIPVQARAWKTAMGLCGKEFTKDDSRALASSMFPVLSAQLRRKKDHGRAEALLIAAFGKGMAISNFASLDASCSSNRIKSPNQPTSITTILATQEL